MVVMLFPPTCETGVTQERVGDPSTCTVQAPHSPAPQPNLVPVSSRVSRNTQSNGVSGETLTFFSLPLTRSVMSAILSVDVKSERIWYSTAGKSEMGWRKFEDGTFRGAAFDRE